MRVWKHVGSNREKKRLAQAGAEKLRQKPGWDPKKVLSDSSPEEALQKLSQDERTQDSYQAAGSCDDCTQERLASGDNTALCEKHLREAFGF